MSAPSAPITIQPVGPFRASITPPGSKSLTNRALLLAALAEGRSTLAGVLFSDDTRVMLDALVKLGFALDIDEAACTVAVEGRAGDIPARAADLYLGNAGTAYRFLTAACCLGDPGSVYTLDGVERMRQRPIGQLVDPLRDLKADIAYLGDEGFPPLRVRAAGLAGGHLHIPPTLSSQYISALLQVGPCCGEAMTIHFDGPVTSRPYVEMTLGLMHHFGAVFEVNAPFTAIRVEPTGYTACDHTIEPDASNASYFLAAAAVIPGAKCTVHGLGFKSLQGDAWFADYVLEKMGASVIYEPDTITVMAPPEGEKLKGIDIDLNPMPDMAQTLAAVALFAAGDTVIRNVGNLRVKETDRLAALQTELTKLGAKVRIEGDDLRITPPNGNRITPAAIDTYDDHRMAMSFAVVGLAAGVPGETPEKLPGVTINDPACVNKTFPEFFSYLDRLRDHRD
jgi:3-phosphoshikimate 1-carboxyvinyltransferase